MIDYRPALASDAPAIARILRVSLRTAMPWLPDLHTPDEDLWFVESRLLPRATVTVAEIDGVPVAYSALTEGWIEHLYILPQHWRAGIGSALIRRVQAHELDLQLWAFQRNFPARRFYEAHGFRSVEFTDGSANEERSPDVRYHWRADRGQFAAPPLAVREMTVADLAPALEMRITTNENAITTDRLEQQYGVTAQSLTPRLSGDLAGWLCESDSQVVGFVMADRSTGELEVLAVRPGYEGLGIGRSLHDRAVGWLESEGCERIWLAANPDPSIRASGFYAKRGWRPTGEVRGEDIILRLEANPHS